jgi:pteridine reductase
MTPRVALITGGSKRVGRAICQRLAEAGFDIAFTYLNSQQEAESLEGELRKMGRQALAIRADFSNPAAAATTIAESFAGFSERLDALVNNASLYESGALAAVTLEQSRRLWAVNVEAPLLLCQRFAPLLRTSRGHVVNMVDLLAERPWSKYLVYCATRAALSNLTLGLARELAPQVTVNGIAPGVVEWPAELSEIDKKTYLRRVPLNRAGRPADVAELVHFLVTTGDYLTGQIIRLDGGRSIT